jgi:hypothetical protein
MNLGIVSINYEEDIKGKEIPIILFIIFLLFVMKSIY